MAVVSPAVFASLAADRRARDLAVAAAAQAAPVRLSFSTDTQSARRRALTDAARAARPAVRDCPGCNGETSTAVGVRLGCTFCAL